MDNSYYVHVGPYAMVPDKKVDWDYYEEIEPMLQASTEEMTHPDDPKTKVMVFMSNNPSIPGWTKDVRYESCDWVVHPSDELIQDDIELFKDKAAKALDLLKKEFGSVEVRWGIFTFVM